MIGSLRVCSFGLAVLVAVWGCQGNQRTELVVQVDSNLVAPGELDKVEVTVTAPGKTPQYVPCSLINDCKLPWDVGVVEATAGAGSIEIVATGYLNKSSVVDETAVLSFVEGKSMLLKLYLAAECRVNPCTNTAQTCTRGGACVDKARKPTDLTPFVPAAIGGSGGNSGNGGDTGSGGTSGAGGGTSGGGSGGSVGRDAGVLDAPATQPDVPIGGTIGSTGGTISSTAGTTGSSGGTIVSLGGTTSSTGGTTISLGGTTSSGGATVLGGSRSSGGVTGTGGVGGGTSSGGLGGSGGNTGTGGTSGSAGAGGTMTAGGTTTSGGTTGAGGTTTTGGTTASGGTTTNGGTTATGGRNPALVAMVKAMAPGWNLGNSFDGTPEVTSWGNPAPNKTLIDAVKAAGFNSIRIPVSWTSHIGAAPSYTIAAAWMASVVETAQWAMDAGLYAFVDTFYDSYGGSQGGWVTFPTDPTPVVAEVTAVWKQIATAFQGFDSKLMFECFNEPNAGGGGATAQAMTDLNQYLAACVNAIRGTGGANATRVIMIQPIGASPSQSGIDTMLQAPIIDDPYLIISIHTYQPTKFGLSTTPYAWGSASDYTDMSSSVTRILDWLPGRGVVIGEWGSMGAQTLANRVAHAEAYSQDTTAAGMCPMWWDNGGAGQNSYAIFDRTSGNQTQPTIINGIVNGVQKGLANPGTYATAP